MLDISFSELALIAAAIIIFIRPDDLPVVLRALGKGLRWLKDLASDFQKIFADVTGDDEKRPKYIRDLEGNLREAYDVSDVVKKYKKEDAAPNSTASPAKAGVSGSKVDPSRRKPGSRREGE